MRTLKAGALCFLLLPATAVATDRARPASPRPTAPEAGEIVDVRSFGARGDGRTLDTAAIDRAIAAAAAAGGGTVRFPAGTYLSVSIHLKSGVRLRLEKRATIEAAAPSLAAYDEPEPNPWGDARRYQDFGHSHWHNALIWGEDLHDVAIEGPGVIQGAALATNDRGPRGAGDKSISLKNCRNVALRDLTILHGGWFAVLATGVDGLTIEHLTIDTNRDGIDIDACRNVRISGCAVNSPFDDAICLKSSYALGRAQTTENVTITRCRVSGYDEGTLVDGTLRKTVADRFGPTGRIKLGTESFGGFRNILVSDCVFERSRGLDIASVDGGSIDRVRVRDITMRDIVNAPIFVRLGSRARGPGEILTGSIRGVDIRRLKAEDVGADQGILVSGVPGHPIERLRLSEIRIVPRRGNERHGAAPGRRGPEGDPPGLVSELPELETDPPEPARFGRLPAYGLYARHVKGLEIRRLELGLRADERRPAVRLDDVDGADLEDLSAQALPGVATFVLRQVREFRISRSPCCADRRLESVQSDSF